MAKKTKTYLVTYHMSAAARTRMMKAMKKNPAGYADTMQMWGDWAKRCGKNLIDMGSPLGNGLKLNSDGQAASKRNLTGYSFIRADNMTAAKKMLKNHPHSGTGCDIEVHEAMPM